MKCYQSNTGSVCSLEMHMLPTAKLLSQHAWELAWELVF